MKLYSFVDNHDVDRIISKIQVKDHIFPIYTLLFTLPGIPSIYYGLNGELKDARRVEMTIHCVRQ